MNPFNREQAEREAKYSRQGSSDSFFFFAFEITTFQGHGHGRSVTAMAAYEGQSGSKDRGDPLVSYTQWSSN